MPAIESRCRRGRGRGPKRHVRDSTSLKCLPATDMRVPPSKGADVSETASTRGGGEMVNGVCCAVKAWPSREISTYIMQLMVIVQSFTSLRRGVRQLRRDVLGVAVASTTHGGWQAAGASVSSVEHAGDDGLARVILEPHILHCASSGVALAVASCTRNGSSVSPHHHTCIPSQLLFVQHLAQAPKRLSSLAHT